VASTVASSTSLLLTKGGSAVVMPMSVASLEAFCARIASDEVLHSQVQAAAGIDDIVAIAAAHGHSVDKTVLLREHARAISGAPDAALAGINSWGDALLHCFGAEQAETEL
jgi:predicted ribosomally synthesized peptide with nif11-like leader